MGFNSHYRFGLHSVLPHRKGKCSQATTVIDMLLHYKVSIVHICLQAGKRFQYNRCHIINRIRYTFSLVNYYRFIPLLLLGERESSSSLEDITLAEGIE